MNDDSAQLFRLLNDARRFLLSAEHNDAWGSITASEFAKLIEDACVEVSTDDLSGDSASALWRAFAPTSDWDDGGGDAELGNAIFELLNSRQNR